jgi:amidase/aspartyl-tRNA(Asn)/glutamyl-tRNA(Gln) amidotransferase subunit A
VNNEICYMSASKIAELIRARELSPLEVVKAYLSRIDERNDRTNAYVTVIAESAIAAAKIAEAQVASDDDIGPLHGVPVALKDSVPLAGVRSTSGSCVFANHVPTVSGIEHERLIGAGAIVLGKTNLPEFAARGTTDNKLFGPTSTPFALGRNSGGSSGGSAAAVADCLAAAAQGSDGGGSIRIPAAWCGVYGLMGTYGRVPSFWRPNGFATHTPFINSGPLTRTVEDAALLLSVLAGPDSRDPLSLPLGREQFTYIESGLAAKLRVGYCASVGGTPVDPEVASVVEEAVTAFESVGASVEPVNLVFPRPHNELAQTWLRFVAVLYATDAAMFLRDGIDLLGEHRHEMTPELVDLMELGQRMSAVEYRLGDVVRTEVLDVIEQVFRRVDVIVSPTVSVLPVENAEDNNTQGPSSVAGEAVDPTIGWTQTYPFNFTGHPAASIPAGFTEGGLPVGMQIIGRRFEEASVLAASAAFERIRPWYSAYAAL